MLNFFLGFYAGIAALWMYSTTSRNDSLEKSVEKIIRSVFWLPLLAAETLIRGLRRINS